MHYAGRNLGAVGVQTRTRDNQFDECPRCGDLKRTGTRLCQGCHLRQRGLDAVNHRAQARALVGEHIDGVKLMLEPGEGMDKAQFAQAIREVLEWIRESSPMTSSATGAGQGPATG